MREGSRSGTGGHLPLLRRPKPPGKSQRRPGARGAAAFRWIGNSIRGNCVKLVSILQSCVGFSTSGGIFVENSRRTARRRRARNSLFYYICRHSGAKCYTKIQKKLRPYLFRGKSAEVWLNFQILTTNPKSRIMTTRSCASGSFPPKTCQAAGPQNKERDKS